jgi:type II secretory pathway component PulL
MLVLQELRQDVKAMHLDMLKQFHQAQVSGWRHCCLKACQRCTHQCSCAVERLLPMDMCPWAQSYYWRILGRMCMYAVLCPFTT